MLIKHKAASYIRIKTAHEMRELMAADKAVDRVLFEVSRLLDDAVCSAYFKSSVDLYVRFTDEDCQEILDVLTRLGYYVLFNPSHTQDGTGAKNYNMSVRWAGAGVPDHD
jgi:hypothetical protein